MTRTTTHDPTTPALQIVRSRTMLVLLKQQS